MQASLHSEDSICSIHATQDESGVTRKFYIGNYLLFSNEPQGFE